jgi:hypothetical protein
VASGRELFAVPAERDALTADQPGVIRAGPEDLPDRGVAGDSAGSVGSGLQTSPASRQAKPPVESEAPPTAQTSAGVAPQMPNTVSVPGVVMRVKAPSIAAEDDPALAAHVHRSAGEAEHPPEGALRLAGGHALHASPSKWITSGPAPSRASPPTAQTSLAPVPHTESSAPGRSAWTICQVSSTGGSSRHAARHTARHAGRTCARWVCGQSTSSDH